MPQLHSLLQKYGLLALSCPAPYGLNDAAGLDAGYPTASRKILAEWGRKGARQYVLNRLEKMSKDQQLSLFAHATANNIRIGATVGRTPEELVAYFSILGTADFESLTEEEKDSYGRLFASCGRATQTAGMNDDEEHAHWAALSARGRAAQTEGMNDDEARAHWAAFGARGRAAQTEGMNDDEARAHWAAFGARVRATQTEGMNDDEEHAHWAALSARGRATQTAGKVRAPRIAFGAKRLNRNYDILPNDRAQYRSDVLQQTQNAIQQSRVLHPPDWVAFAAPDRAAQPAGMNDDEVRAPRIAFGAKRHRNYNILPNDRAQYRSDVDKELQQTQDAIQQSRTQHPPAV
jgi:hypothetical protein